MATAVADQIRAINPNLNDDQVTAAIKARIYGSAAPVKAKDGEYYNSSGQQLTNKDDYEQWRIADAEANFYTNPQTAPFAAQYQTVSAPAQVQGTTSPGLIGTASDKQSAGDKSAADATGSGASVPTGIISNSAVQNSTGTVVGTTPSATTPTDTIPSYNTIPTPTQTSNGGIGSLGATTGTGGTANTASYVQPTSAGVTNWNVTPNQTVQGQLQGLLDSNNPLMVKARTQALQSMNDRGLLNSSLSATAGEQAMLDAALPIAQADATTYGTAAQANAQAANQAAITNATLQNQWAISNLDNATKTNLANIEANYKGLMQLSSSVASMWTTTMSQLTSIMQDSNMSAEAKQNAINQLINSLATGLEIQGTMNGVDLGSLLDFS